MKRICLATTACSVLLFSFLSQSMAKDKSTLEVALALAKGLGEDQCMLQHQDHQDDSFEPQLYKFSHKDTYDDEARDYQLFRIPCWMAAYNQGDAFVLFDSYGEASLIAFAVPDYTIKYVDPESDEKVESVIVTGYRARMTVGFSDFNPETLQISEYHKSRGLGDASTSAIWQYSSGTFVLRSFSVDASYDGELNQNGLVNFGASK